jgi:hypothetical protein
MTETKELLEAANITAKVFNDHAVSLKDLDPAECEESSECEDIPAISLEDQIQMLENHVASLQMEKRDYLYKHEEITSMYRRYKAAFDLLVDKLLQKQ